MRYFGAMLLGLLLVACQNSSDNQPTPTPPRPSTIEAVYTSPPDGTLQVTVSEVRLLEEIAEPDIQVIAVLTDGGAPPAFALLPSNQSGIQANSISLADYPLRLSTSESGRLWVFAMTHTAYPVGEIIGQYEIARLLSEAFHAKPDADTTAEIVATAGESLFAWFGQLETLGEFFTPVSIGQSGEKRISAGGLEVRYHVGNGSDSVAMLPPTPTPVDEPTAAPPEIFGVPVEGYRRVIYENFEGAQSSIPWWIGSDPTYSANIVNRAYQITLTGVDDYREAGLSWGSIQEHSFDDYVIRAQMRVSETDGLARLGLWLHYVDDFNFLFFGIENTGRYRVARFQRTYTELSPWQNSPAIHTGDAANILEVRLEGNTYTLAINGEVLSTTTDDAFDEGRITFFCYSENIPATCLLEEIEVWIPESQPFPRTTPTDTPE